MTNLIIEFILHTLGISIIWGLIIHENKEFKLISKKGFLTILIIAIAVILIKIKI